MAQSRANWDTRSEEDGSVGLHDGDKRPIPLHEALFDIPTATQHVDEHNIVRFVYSGTMDPIDPNRCRAGHRSQGPASPSSIAWLRPIHAFQSGDAYDTKIELRACSEPPED